METKGTEKNPRSGNGQWGGDMGNAKRYDDGGISQGQASHLFTFLPASQPAMRHFSYGKTMDEFLWQSSCEASDQLPTPQGPQGPLKGREVGAWGCCASYRAIGEPSNKGIKLKGAMGLAQRYSK